VAIIWVFHLNLCHIIRLIACLSLSRKPNQNRVPAWTFERFIFGIMFQAFMFLLLFRFGFSNDVPASFVFGDSLLDVGNNNYIVSLAKANHDPFGIDFGMPTGRFSNGRTVVDVISESFWFPLRSIFLDFFVQILV